MALVRGRLEGKSLTGVEDVFVAESWGGSVAAARLAFAPGGSRRSAQESAPQSPTTSCWAGSALLKQ